MDEFMVPDEPDQLWSGDVQLEFKVQQLTDYEDNVAALNDACDSIAFVLCDQDPLCIVEQENFDVLCSIVRCFHLLEGPKRRQLLDALCSSLTCLNAWIDRLLSSPSDTIEKETLAHYRSAFKAYLFFLHWTSITASREAATATSQASSVATGTTKGRGRKKAAADFAEWDWESQFPKVMKAIGQSLNTDLWALFRPNRPDENVLVKLIQLSITAIESPNAAKHEELAAGAAHVLAVCALKYQQLEAVGSALVDALNKYEHTPPLVAELLRYSVAQWDDGRLAATVLGEVAAVDPAEYERQQNATGEKAGVRSVAEFIQEMANRMPRLMAHQIALFLPHLGGKAWTLRSGIVTAIGYLLHKAFDTTSSQDAADAQGVAARLRSKQHLLDVLCERVRDQSSYTRKAVLQTWQYLAENRAVPLGHWQVVTEIATGRLEDKSSLVRKEALRLLQSLMLHNPFGPQLPVDRFAASLAAHKAMLDQVLPPSNDDEVLGGDGIEQSIAVEKVANEGTEEDEDVMEADDEENATTTEEEEKVAVVVTEEQEPPRPAKTPAEVGWDGSVEELQALVASLELAVDFARSLSGCMPVLTQLLASSTISDVQESIALLLTCKQFTVAGAPEAIRKMLPLVFSRDQAVKDRIIEALDQLYVTGWAGNTFTSAQAARNLVGLAAGATLGELGALEDVIKEFVFRGFVSPVMLHELWDVAATAHAAASQGAQGAARAVKDLRAALAVLSYAAAHQPDAFSERHVEMLLRFGLGDGRWSDALASRHACYALLKLADNLNTGLYDGLKTETYAALIRTLVASPLPEDVWCSAAEAAITCLYNLHPQPELVCSSVLRRLSHRAGFTDEQLDDEDGVDAMDCDAMEIDDNSEETPVTEEGTKNTMSSAALNRLFFVLGQVGLQHLVYVERLAKTVRRQRMDAEKRMLEEKAERATKRNASKRSAADSSDEEDEDINAELGVGSVAADAELDAMKDACEAQILASNGLLGPFARLVSAICHSRVILAGDARLRSSALLSLCKLMTVDAAFCDANLQLVFTLLQNRSVEAGLRCNLIVALGDLALRFPNNLEPWTEHVYRPLGDPDVAVRKTGLMVLTHLILNDMMKVKGHIAKMAVCLEDEDTRVSALAQLFFHELAKKEYKGTSPIYNLLPDILSNLSSDPSLGRGKFQSVMQQLLGYIKKDKQGDALVDKLCQRIAATEDRGQWRNVVFCLSQLPLSEKGLRRLSENFKLYKTALADTEVTDTINGILAKAKKNVGSAKAEVKQLVEELEAKIVEAAAERAEEEATADAARRRAAKDRGEVVSDDEDVAPVATNCNSGDVEMEDVEMMDTTAPSPAHVGVKLEEEEEQGDVSRASSPLATTTLSVQQSAVDDVTVKKEEGAEEEEEQSTAPRRTTSKSSTSTTTSTRTATRRTASTRRNTSTTINDDDDENQQDNNGDDTTSVSSKATATRSTRSTRSKTTASVEVVPSKTRTSRRSARSTMIDSDDDDGDINETKIAAIQAGVRRMRIKTEDEA